MSIISMSKMSLVAHASEQSKLLKIFLKAGYVEVIRSERSELTSYPDVCAMREEINNKLFKISFALNFLRDMTKEQKKLDKDKAVVLNLKKENRLIDLEEYNEVEKEEIELFLKIENMGKINSQLVDIKSEKSRLNAYKEQLLVYKGFEIPFNEIKNTHNTIMVAGTVPTNRLTIVEQGLAEDAVVKTYSGDNQSAIIIIAHKDNSEKVNAVLSANDFIKNNFDMACTAAEKIAELDSKNENLNNANKQCIEDALGYIAILSELKILYDYYGFELAKLDCMAACPHTKKAFLMEGWLPSDKVNELQELITSKCKRAEVIFREPLEGETPPTFCKNNKFVHSFEGITDMFGAPNYREADPNWLVAIYYFLFFGIMISDGGYGILMALACFLIVKLKKPVKNSGQMLMMFGFCGISTIVWGALFGGWFSITLPEGSFLDKIMWFNPLEEPLKMFMLALGMGVLQIGTGFALKGVSEIKKGRILKGILNYFSWDVIFIGLCLISPMMMVFLGAINPDPIPEIFGSLASIGKYIAIAGFVMLLIGGALGKKNPLKMVGGALGNVYGGINVVSDLLSYSRLFGLGLTTVVIGYVVNMVADIVVNVFMGGSWAGWIIAIPVLIIGHSFNLAINLLGAYVHDSRLQYIEFFGRFYEGNGHAFNPLGSKSKYTYLNN